MSMIVQTLSVLETDEEQSLEDVITQKFEVRKSDESIEISKVEE